MVCRKRFNWLEELRVWEDSYIICNESEIIPPAKLSEEEAIGLANLAEDLW